MDASFFIAGRLRFKGRIVMVSVAVSFLVMILAVSVSSGFRSEVRAGLSMISGDVQLVPPTMDFMDEKDPIESDAAYFPYVERVDGVEHVIPVIYRAGILKNGENIHGVLFKGLPADKLPVYGVELSDTARLPVSIPSRLAEICGLDEGDRMLAYFVGKKVKARQFNVVSIYDAMVETDDKLVVYASLSDMQKVNGWRSDEVSAVEIMLAADGRDEINGISREIGTVVNAYSSDREEPVIAVSSVSKYPQLYDWLDLIDFNVVFILILMMIVAGFNMISGLLIMLFENISTIGLLKSLGMKDRAISKVFLSSSAVLVFKGMFWGNLIAFILCIIQNTTHILKLDPENYFVSYVPVNLDVAAILAADSAAFAVIMLLLLVPCLFIAKVDPAETVRVK